MTSARPHFLVRFLAVSVAVSALTAGSWLSPMVNDAQAADGPDITVRGMQFQTLVPAGVTAVTIRAIGGAGETPAAYGGGVGSRGGYGAIVEASFRINPGDRLIGYVASDSAHGLASAGTMPGGIGRVPGATHAGGAGGTATNVSVNSGGTHKDLVVAGGGGGGAHVLQGENARGGDASGLIGGSGTAVAAGGAPATGGTQQEGGQAGVYLHGDVAGTDGVFGRGGTPGYGIFGHQVTVIGGGGGGGYYGGGGGSQFSGGGAGSSYVDATAINPTFATNSERLTPVVEITYVYAEAESLSLSLSTSTVAADGASTYTATAAVFDQFGDPLPGQSVALAIGGQPTGAYSFTDNGDGTYSAVITSTTTPGSFGVYATLGSLQDSKTVRQVGSATLMTIRPISGPLVADGQQTGRIRVSVTDSALNSLPQENVTITSSGVPVVIGPVAYLPGDQVYEAFFTVGTSAGELEFTVTDHSVSPALVRKATLTLVAGEPDSATVTVTEPSIVADERSQTVVTAHIVDEHGNSVSGLNPTLRSTDVAQTLGGFSEVSAGVYEASVRSSLTVGQSVLQVVLDAGTASELVVGDVLLTQTAIPTPGGGGTSGPGPGPGEGDSDTSGSVNPSSPASPNSGQLSSTGFELSKPSWLVAILVLAGAGALVFSRRREV